MCRVPSCLRLPRSPIPPWAPQLPLIPHTLHYLCNSYSNAKAIIHGRTVPSTKVCLSAPAPCTIPSGFIIQIKEVLHAFFVFLVFFGNNLQATPLPLWLSLFQERLWPRCPFHSSEGGSGGSSLCVSRVSGFTLFSATH